MEDKDYLDFAILKTLEEKTIHGSMILRELKERLKENIPADKFVFSLDSLERKKFIISMDVPLMSGFNKAYRITREGKTEIEAKKNNFRDFLTFMGHK